MQTGPSPPPPMTDDIYQNRETVGIHYNPEQIPPDWTQAQNHLRATSVGFLPEDKKANFTIDPQSSEPIEKEQYPLCIPRKNLNSMGSGYPLYFEFLVYCCYILLFFFCVSGAYNLATNQTSADCVNNVTATVSFFNATTNTTQYRTRNRDINGQVCANSWSITLSIANKGSDDTLSEVQHYVNLAAFIVVICVLHFFRRKQGITNLFVDESSLTASDYTAMVKKIPLINGEDTDDSIKRFFETEAVKGKTINVKKVNLGYNLTEYYDLRDERNVELAKKKEFYRLQHQNKKFDEQKAAEVDAKLDEIHKKMHIMENEFMFGVSNKFCGVAFVSFNTQAELKEVLAAFEETLWRRFVHLISKVSGGDGYPVYKSQYYIQVKQAPEPSEIKWDNLGAGTFRAFRRRAVSWILALIMLGGCFVAIFYMTINTSNDTNASGDQDISVRALSICAAILVSVLNVVIKIIMRKLSDYELYDTVTKHNISLASKLALVQFVNTALITFIAAIVANNYFAAGGMTESITNMFISNAVIGPLTSFVDSGYQFMVVKRWLEARKGKDSVMTQEEANTLFEGNDFDVAARYAEVLKTMYFTAFYAHVIPLGFLISLFYMILTYWIDKYTLLRRSKEPRALGGSLSIEMTEMIEYILPLYAVGQIVFDHIILLEISWVSWLVLGLSIMNAFLPMQALNEFVFPLREEKVTQETFDDVRIHFPGEYDRENPATHENAAKEFHKFVQNNTGKLLKRGATIKSPRMNSPVRMASPKAQFTIRSQDTINEAGNAGGAQFQSRATQYFDKA